LRNEHQREVAKAAAGLSEVKPDRLKVWKYYFISCVFGFTFDIKLMERGEENAQKKYGQISETIQEADRLTG
jgi:hypothetical protein